ncbi:MAG TPA: DUF1634 domain-containing protein [Anaerolineae bacterium]|nr:DUF1634 domain-containing protein [Anaerolineae bacterium]HIQ06099.1 DUF1634 domain-containing protein [Anaerolineae bacterium]
MSLEQDKVSKGRKSRLHSPLDIEIAMQRMSLALSLIALLLMVGGFGSYALTPGESLHLPGGSVVPLEQLIHLSASPAGLVLMSLGIVILAVLPAVRVLLALILYARQAAWTDAIIALGVLITLLFSTRVR